MLLELKQNLIYGPIKSRRLGSSLGINLLPSDRKTCTLNCQYCQYGWTSSHCLEGDISGRFPSVEKVFSELEHALNTINPQPSYLTFSGNGEPTLHPEFEEVLDRVIWLRNRKARFSKTAILSNSTTINNSSIRKTLTRLDVKIMKLDAGNPETFSRYNQPISEICFKDIVNGLAMLENATIQTLFSNGPHGNFKRKHIEDWIKNIKKINPVTVQLYTLDRTPPSKKIFAVSPDELFQIHIRLKKEKIMSEVY